jgi:hypothetical protein
VRSTTAAATLAQGHFSSLSAGPECRLERRRLSSRKTGDGPAVPARRGRDDTHCHHHCGARHEYRKVGAVMGVLVLMVSLIFAMTL